MRDAANISSKAALCVWLREFRETEEEVGRGLEGRAEAYKYYHFTKSTLTKRIHPTMEEISKLAKSIACPFCLL